MFGNKLQNNDPVYVERKKTYAFVCVCARACVHVNKQNETGRTQAYN